MALEVLVSESLWKVVGLSDLVDRSQARAHHVTGGKLLVGRGLAEPHTSCFFVLGYVNTHNRLGSAATYQDQPV